MEQIHGHEVIEMMMQSGKSYSREVLLQDINDRFGTETKFFTCSAEDLSASQLIDFLDSKNKFLPKEDGFNFDPEKKCEH